MTAGADWVIESAEQADSWEDLRQVSSGCVACPLHEWRTQVVFADGDAPADVTFVGEAPGEQEDLSGVPFVGRSGQLLRSLLSDVGIDPSQVVIANVIKCRPPLNRDPLPAEVDTCRFWLRRQVHLVDPAVICTVGAFATRWALGPEARITKVRGQRFTVADRLVIPTFHPAAALRSGPQGEQMLALRSDIGLLASVIAEVRAR